MKAVDDIRKHSQFIADENEHEERDKERADCLPSFYTQGTGNQALDELHKKLHDILQSAGNQFCIPGRKDEQQDQDDHDDPGHKHGLHMNGDPGRYIPRKIMN